MRYENSKNNLFARIASLFVAMAFIFSSVDASLVLAQPQYNLNTHKLATPSIWRPLANEGYAISEQLQFELFLGTRLLYKNRGNNLESVNSTLNRLFEARKRALRKEPLTKKALEFGTIEFLTCTWNRDFHQLKATFRFRNKPNLLFQIVYTDKRSILNTIGGEKVQYKDVFVQSDEYRIERLHTATKVATKPRTIYVFDYDSTIAERNTQIEQTMADRLAGLIIDGDDVAILTAKTKKEMEKLGIDIPGALQKSLLTRGYKAEDAAPLIRKRLFFYLGKSSEIYDGGFNLLNEAFIIEEDLEKILAVLGRPQPNGRIEEAGIYKFGPNTRVIINQNEKGNITKVQIQPFGEEFSETSVRDKIADELSVLLRKTGLPESYFVESGGKTSIDITPTSKASGIRRLLREGYEKVIFVGDEPKGNDKLAFDLVGKLPNLYGISVAPADTGFGRGVKGTEFLLDNRVLIEASLSESPLQKASPEIYATRAKEDLEQKINRLSALTERAASQKDREALRDELKTFIKSWAIASREEISGEVWRANYDRISEVIEQAAFKILGIKHIWEFKPKRPIRVILTGAGMGTRMPDPNYPKVMYEVDSRPMLYYTIDITSAIDASPVIAVRPENWVDNKGKPQVGGTKKVIEEGLAKAGYKANLVDQVTPLGDGHVIQVALESEVLKDFDGDAFVMWGDMPCAYEETVLRSVMLYQALGDVSFMLLGFPKREPYAYVVTDSKGAVAGNIKYKTAPKPRYGLDDIGIFIGDANSIREALKQYPRDEKTGDFLNPLRPEDKSPGNRGEMTFAQMTAIIHNQAKEVLALPVADEKEFKNVNTGADIPIATQYRREAETERVRKLEEAKDVDTVTNLLARMTLTEDVMSAAVKALRNAYPKEENFTGAIRTVEERLKGFLNGAKAKTWQEFAISNVKKSEEALVINREAEPERAVDYMQGLLPEDSETKPTTGAVAPTLTSGIDFKTMKANVQISSDVGKEARKKAEAKFEGEMHLIFVTKSIPEIQRRTTVAINVANLCKEYYNNLGNYTVHIVKDHTEALELLARPENSGWNQTNTIIGPVDKEDLEALTKELPKGKAKVLAMEKAEEGQYVPIKGFFDLMSIIVRINRPLDKVEDEELIYYIQELLNKIGVSNAAGLVNCLTTEDVKDPVKFASNFIIRLLPPTKKLETRELKELYDAAKTVVLSL